MVPARGGRLVKASQLPDWAQLQWAKAPMLARPAFGCRDRASRRSRLPLLGDLGMGPD